MERVPCAWVALPAGASPATALSEVHWPFPALPPGKEESFRFLEANFFHLGQLFIIAAKQWLCAVGRASPAQPV